MVNTGAEKLARTREESPDAIEAIERTKKTQEGQRQTVRPTMASQPDTTSFVDDATTLAETGWKNIIWREWCRAKDEEYAEYLYPLVRTSVLGWKFVALFALLCAMGGVIFGLFLGTLLIEVFDQISYILSSLDLFNIFDSINTLSWLRPLFAWGLGVVGAALGVWSSRMYRTWYYWWQGPPPPNKVESALREACRTYPEVERIWSKPLHRLTLEKVRHRPVKQLIAELANPNWSYRFAARLALAARGGEAAAELHKTAIDRNDPLWEVATWLLTDIEQQTRNTYAWRANDTVCPHCLTRFGSHPFEIPLGVTFTIYGCRLCSQSLNHYYVPQGVVATLDNENNEEPSFKDGLLQVNWLTSRALFDFDQVEIVRATDEEVERFAVQVGNDMDTTRGDHYKHMPCRVCCVLSQNTLRILRRTFGNVEERVSSGKDHVCG